MLKAIPMAMALALATGPFAQTPGGPGPSQVASASPAPAAVVRLVQVEGDVLASTQSGLAAAAEGTALPPGTRVMTMARSRAGILYADGCLVALKPNMRVEVAPALSCEERQALARMVVLDPATEIALEGALETPTASIPALVLGGSAGGVAAGLGGAAAIIANRPGESVSPN